MDWAIWAEMLKWFVHELKWSYGGDWILCRRLEWERSTVSSRVALLLRSAEVKLLFYRFVQLNCWILLFSFLSMYSLQGRFIWTCAGQWSARMNAHRWVTPLIMTIIGMTVILFPGLYDHAENIEQSLFATDSRSLMDAMVLASAL